jgi:hypothetical protein
MRQLPFALLFSFYAGTVPEVTKSFGFSAGDFITAIELANMIRKDFVGA